MALSQRLDLRQSQSLVMTPQLQQAIKLLQFSNAELTEFVERELEKNPLLETDEGEQSYAEEASQQVKKATTSWMCRTFITSGSTIPNSLQTIKLTSTGSKTSGTRRSVTCANSTVFQRPNSSYF